MMNIICNNCVGGFITRDILSQQYINPFIWTTTEANDMCYLIEHYDDIRWDRFSLDMDDKFTMFGIIDDAVRIRFTHYKFAKGANSVVVGGPERNDVYYNRIWEYIVDKYVARIKRMRENNIRPTFICCGANDRPRYTFGSDFTPAQQTRAYNAASANKFKCIISFKHNVNMPDNEYVNIMHQPTSFKHDGTAFASFIWQNAFQAGHDKQMDR